MMVMEEKEAFEQEKQGKKYHKVDGDDDSVKGRPPNPFENATLLSRCSFSYAKPLLNIGKSRPIQQADLPDLHPFETSDYNRQLIEDIWERECKNADESVTNNCGRKKRKKNLGRAIFWYYLKSTWWAEVLMAVNMAARIGQAVVLGLLMDQFGRYGDENGGKESDEDHNSGASYFYAILLVVTGFIAFPTKQQQFFETYRKGVQLKLGFVSAIFAKILRLPSNNSITSGHVTNLVSNDVERIMTTSVVLPFLIQGPVVSIVILIVGIHVIGPVFVAGFGLLCILIPIQVFIGKKFAFFRSQVAPLTDKRITMVSQAVSGARVMKMNAWELEFEERIAKLRSHEVAMIQKASRFRGLNEALYFFSAPVVSVFMFVVHVSFGGTLTPRNVFTTLTLMGIIQFLLTKHLPNAVMGLAECFVSCKRIQAFLELPEHTLANRENTHENINDDTQLDKEILKLEEVTCHWKPNVYNNDNRNIDVPKSVALSNVSFRFSTNQLYCIIGRVGSSKSALLQSITGELPLSGGQISSCYGSMSYAAQEPWIMDGTIRENITMGLNYDKKWYERVVEACGLAPDIAVFKNMDQTIVGDRGVQLSGGQRARLGLARALYCDTEIILLDDPLSAVDAQVAYLIFFNAILDLAVRRGKCVILVTHQLQFVGSSNCLLMGNGELCCSGSFEDCVKASNGDLSDTIQVEEELAIEDNVTSLSTPELAPTVIGSSNLDESTNNEIKSDTDHAEKRDTGIISLDTWLSYGKSLGGVVVCLFLFLIFAVTQGLLLLIIVLLGRWAEAPPDEQNSTFWVVMISSLTVSLVILSVFRAEISFFLLVKTAQKLHDRMLHFVLRSKIEFFDTNPVGRILNRFSADVGIIDETLPFTYHDFLVGFFMVIGSLITSGVVLPFILLVLPFLLWYFLVLRKVFVATTRELKRLDGIGRSPVYSMVSEALAGIATIRSNSKVEYFMQKFQAVHDAHTRAYFAFIVSSRWFAFNLDLISFILMSAATLLAVLFDDQNWFDVDSVILGLALTLLIQISTTNFPWVVRQSAELCNQMVSVERIVAYGSLKSEAPLEVKFDKDIGDWPQDTSMTVQNLTTRYRSNLPPVLSDISFKIMPGEKVGIIGRTGSGKSSLVQTLFRILEAEAGAIEVGGIDISLMGLHKVRKAMAVISQVPVLFSGCNIHENLDPFYEYEESEVYEALKAVQMIETINELPLGLKTPVDEGGSNFSVGQRQLLCLARALLSKSKILVLDEPSANIDNNTDKLLTRTLKEKFADATILMVTHRLQTILDYDRVLVLGNRGRVLEFGAPEDLLLNEDGHFFSMLKSAGNENIADA